MAPIDCCPFKINVNQHDMITNVQYSPGVSNSISSGGRIINNFTPRRPNRLTGSEGS